MACFELPIHQNPLRTRKDVERALLQLLEPVKGRFTAGNAGLKLGAHAAHYGEGSARMEAFSRMLWGLGPLCQNAGSYYVEAVVRENSDKYKGDASGQVLFAIA
ncbi:MAG: DUF2264 domain-containing protein, partial [Oscillospiraceae bacterium]|nr:DUF2264 domain-containing protein [Oscillospiraceae bacterium]